MKKTIAVVLMLCIAFMSVSAFAETRTFYMAGVQDPEGNTVTFNETEMAVLVFAVDDENMVCAFGSEEALIAGTYEIAEQTDETVTLDVTLEDGSELMLIYVIAEDSFAYVDEEGYVYVLMNVDTLEEQAAA